MSQYRYRVTIELTQHFRPHHLIHAPSSGLSTHQIDQAIHHRQQRIHIVSRHQHGNVLDVGQRTKQCHQCVGTAKIQIGQGFIENQQARLTHQSMGNHRPLLLTTREFSYPLTETNALRNAVERGTLTTVPK